MDERRNYRTKPKHTPEMTDTVGKLPPRATDIEEAVLGAIMLEKDAYSNVCELLVPDSFYDPVNRKIYEAISELGFNQRPIDMMTVTEQLRQDNALDEVGGAVHIAELTSRLLVADRDPGLRRKQRRGRPPSGGRGKTV